jgi:DNA-binding MarR family transcriptional regulator
MNKTVQLVNEWADFDEQYPEADIEEFCRYYLIKKREAKNQHEKPKGPQPPQQENMLLKLLGGISCIGQVYAQELLSDLPKIQPKDFYYLVNIWHEGDSHKTDIINRQLSELSTGIDILNHLKNMNLIEERVDPTDRRAKLISITDKGEKTLYQCFRRMSKVGAILFDEVAEEDRKLCIQLLKKVVVKHSKLALEVKNKGIDGVFDMDVDINKDIC